MGEDGHAAGLEDRGGVVFEELLCGGVGLERGVEVRQREAAGKQVRVLPRAQSTSM